MKQIIVHTPTEEDWNEVVKMSNKLWGSRWTSCDVLDFDSSIYVEETCIRIYGDDLESLAYADRDFYRFDGAIYEVQEFKDLWYPRVLDDCEIQEANTNPKQALGLANIPMNLLSPITCAYGSIGKLNGKMKYGLSNYLGTQVIMSIYMDAIRRHIDGIMSGEEHDPADGVPHWSAILANVDIILCARAAGTLIDDRPLLKGYREEMDKLKPIVSNLKELHKDKNPKHYYLNEENNDA